MGEKLFERFDTLYIVLLIACTMVIVILLLIGLVHLFRKIPARLPSSHLMPPDLSRGEKMEEDQFHVPDGQYSIHKGKSRLAGRGHRGA